MKKLLSILLPLLFVSNISAAEHERVSVNNTHVRKVGSNVEVTFEVSVDKLNSHYSVVLLPTLYNADREKVLEEVTLVGKKKNFYDIRNNRVKGSNRIVLRKTKEPIKYKTVVPYEDWMSTISLKVNKTVSGCCNDDDLGDQQVTDNALLHYDVDPLYRQNPFEYQLTELEKYSLEHPFLHPVEDYERRYELLLKDRGKGAAAVHFKVGSATIDMSIPGNKELLERMERAFELILKDPNANLKQIMIAGYASPEGSLKSNTALAQRRAEAVRRYLTRNLDIPKGDNFFELYNGREDWDGLREKVDNSDMDHRQEVLNVIDSYTMEQEQRKNELKKIDGGKPYKFMLANYYPPLRNAGYIQVYYDIDRTATVATAVTDEFGRTTWLDPDSPANIGVTRLNRAIAYMKESNYEAALRELETLKDEPVALNFVGVCYMMLEDYDTAEDYLNRALDNGDEFAARNLEQIATARKVQK